MVCCHTDPDKPNTKLTFLDQICKGFYEINEFEIDKRANNITYPAVQCGSILGASLPTSPQASPASIYSRIEARQKNLYVCASGLRASVKTVVFQYNSPGSVFSNLEVLQIEDKTYTEEESQPLWAVEHSGNRRMWFDLLWGIVDDPYETMDGFYTQRSKGLWLPASPFLRFGVTQGSDALAAVSGLTMRLKSLYDAISVSERDYSGQYEFTLFERFQRLSSNETMASQIPSLILTDKLAAAFVGTKTSISNQYVKWPASLAVDDRVRGFPRAQVRANKRVVRYNMRYAIPGLLVLTVLLGAYVVAIWVLLSTESTLTTMRNVYNQTSPGRLATNLLLPGQCDPKQPSRQWIRGDGALRLSFGHITAPEQDHFCKILGLSTDSEPQVESRPESSILETSTVENSQEAVAVENAEEAPAAENSQETAARENSQCGAMAESSHR